MGPALISGVDDYASLPAPKKPGDVETAELRRLSALEVATLLCQPQTLDVMLGACVCQRQKALMGWFGPEERAVLWALQPDHKGKGEDKDKDDGGHSGKQPLRKVVEKLQTASGIKTRTSLLLPLLRAGLGMDATQVGAAYAALARRGYVEQCPQLEQPGALADLDAPLLRLGTEGRKVVRVATRGECAARKHILANPGQFAAVMAEANQLLAAAGATKKRVRPRKPKPPKLASAALVPSGDAAAAGAGALDVIMPDTSSDAAIAAALAMGGGLPTPVPKQPRAHEGKRKRASERDSSKESKRRRSASSKAAVKAHAEAMKDATPPEFLHDETAPAARVCLRRPTHASHLRLTEDSMTMYSRRSYRMCRATHGVVYGRWYFEVKVTHLGATGHSRVGWAGDRAELQAPVGYDAHSYAYRDINGVKVHAGHRKWYGEPYSVGDVLGCLLVLPEREDMPPCRAPQLAKYKHELVVLREDGDEKYQHRPLPGSRVAFFKNGVCQGVAYENTLCEDVYFPAGSLYTDKNIEGDDAPPASLTFNFGPDFAFPPQGVRFAQPVRAEGGVAGQQAAAAEQVAAAEQEGIAIVEGALAEEAAAGGPKEHEGETGQAAVPGTEGSAEVSKSTGGVKATLVAVDGKAIRADCVRPFSEALHFQPTLLEEEEHNKAPDEPFQSIEARTAAKLTPAPAKADCADGDLGHLQMMGFSVERAMAALDKCNDDLEAAVNWLFINA